MTVWAQQSLGGRTYLRNGRRESHLYSANVFFAVWFEILFRAFVSLV